MEDIQGTIGNVETQHEYLPRVKQAVAPAAEVSKLDSMTPTQCRAARALLDWSQPQLAETAGVGLSTVVDFERERRNVSARAVRSIRLALENAGVMFLGGDGVRLIPPRGRRR